MPTGGITWAIIKTDQTLPSIAARGGVFGDNSVNDYVIGANTQACGGCNQGVEAVIKFEVEVYEWDGLTWSLVYTTPTMTALNAVLLNAAWVNPP